MIEFRRAYETFDCILQSANLTCVRFHQDRIQVRKIGDFCDSAIADYNPLTRSMLDVWLLTIESFTLTMYVIIGEIRLARLTRCR